MTACNHMHMEHDQLDAFGERLVDVLNQSALALMISVGHKTRLFDVMAGMAPSTSEDIARAARLDERYVREWLGAMYTGGLITYDISERTYALPAEHAAWLTRGAQNGNLAATISATPMLAKVEDRIIGCFENGGGLTYADYTGFHDWMCEDSEQSVVANLLEDVLPLEPRLVNALEHGANVLDIGCGRGRAVMRLAEAFPQSRFVGYDLCEDAIEDARRELENRGLTNARFEVRDVTGLDSVHEFDVVTAFDAIHDQAHPDVVLRGIARALKSDGIFLMQDIRASSHLEKNAAHPFGPFLYTVSCMHCMSVSLGQGGMGLGTVWGEELAVKMLGEAGFRDVAVHKLEHDIQNNWYVARPPSTGR